MLLINDAPKTIQPPALPHKHSVSPHPCIHQPPTLSGCVSLCVRLSVAFSLVSGSLWVHTSFLRLSLPHKYWGTLNPTWCYKPVQTAKVHPHLPAKNFHTASIYYYLQLINTTMWFSSSLLTQRVSSDPDSEAPPSGINAIKRSDHQSQWVYWHLFVLLYSRVFENMPILILFWSTMPGIPIATQCVSSNSCTIKYLPASKKMHISGSLGPDWTAKQLYKGKRW